MAATKQLVTKLDTIVGCIPRTICKKYLGMPKSIALRCTQNSAPFSTCPDHRVPNCETTDARLSTGVGGSPSQLQSRPLMLTTRKHTLSLSTTFGSHLCTFNTNYERPFLAAYPSHVPNYRLYSTDGGNEENDGGKSRVYLKLMNLREVIWPNVVKTFRNMFFKFLIAGYYDKSFTPPSFLDGAEQAARFVSSLISEGKWEELRGFLNVDAIDEIKRHYSELSVQQRKFIAINPKDIFLRFIYEIGMIFDDETNQRFVEITVVFQGLHGLDDMKSNDPEGYHQQISAKQENIYVCNYRFIREFTKGVQDDWNISALNHFSPKK